MAHLTLYLKIWYCSAVYELCMTSFKKLLLMGGDIQSNPGPELKEIAKQLTVIASDIKDIKEKRLADIDSKLDVITNVKLKSLHAMQKWLV